MRIFNTLIVLSVALILAGCKGSGSGDVKEVMFTEEVVHDGDPVTVATLDESDNPLGVIKDFAMVNDTAFVIVDGKEAFLYNTAGDRILRFGYRGRGYGEMISPSLVCVSPENVYIWCSSLMSVLTFSHEGKFRRAYTGFERAVKKFAVDNDQNLYLYTSGFRSEAGDRVEEVVQVYNLGKGKIVDSFGERSGADEVMAAFANSAGISSSEQGGVWYIHPASLAFYNRSGDGKNASFRIEGDKEFEVERVTNFHDITSNPIKWMEFIPRNSVVRHIGSDHGKTYIVAEVGEFSPQSQDKVGSRRIKTYVLSEEGSPLKTLTCGYVQTPAFQISGGKLFFITTQIEDAEKGDQRVCLNFYPLT